MRLTLTRRGDVPIPGKVRRAMFAAAANAFPDEACGILLGRAGRITIAREGRNVHPEPSTHFEIDPQQLIAAHRAEREGGLNVMGYFHSHPTGDPHPSETDRALAAGDGKVWAIIGGEKLILWQDEPNRFCALSYEVTGR